MDQSDPVDVRPRVGVRELRNPRGGRRCAAPERASASWSRSDGRPVAQLGPLSPDDGPTLDDLVAAGLAVAPRRAGHLEPPAPIAVAVDVRVASVLGDLRGGR